MRILPDKRCVGGIDPRKIQLSGRKGRKLGSGFVYDDHHQTIDTRAAKRFWKPFGPAKHPALIRSILHKLERAVAHRMCVEWGGTDTGSGCPDEVMSRQDGQVGEHVREHRLHPLEPKLYGERIDHDHVGDCREVPRPWVRHRRVAGSLQGPHYVGRCRGHPIVPRDIIPQVKSQDGSPGVPAPRRQTGHRPNSTVIRRQCHEENVLLNLFGQRVYGDERIDGLQICS